MKLLGLSASLRNVRHGVGSKVLVKQIKGIHSREHLFEFLNDQAQLSLSQYAEASLKEKRPFDEISRKLRKSPGKYGLSNSETLLSACLWAAVQNGIEIEHVALSEYFGDHKVAESKKDKLLNKVKSADGILVSGPVYFGDRSSLVHDFIQLLRQHRELVEGKIFAGASVGAKRNGGQETCLIYQMLDFLNIGMLAVGNDSETTAQYGGTGHGGHIGTVAKDAYGVNMSIGTGNRIARVIRLMDYSKKSKLKDKPKIGIIILQDKNEIMYNFIRSKILDSKLVESADFRFFYFINETVKKCMACDFCPEEVGEDKAYRCIIKNKKDLFVKYHKELVDLDAILIGAYSPKSFYNFSSIYQTFVERTRYLRRGDYVFSDRLVAPLILKEVGSSENLELRILTSMIRHLTIMHVPLIFNIRRDKLIDFSSSFQMLKRFVELTRFITVGRIQHFCHSIEDDSYNPVGYYTLTSLREHELTTIKKRKEAMEKRKKYFKQMQIKRVEIC